MGSVDLLELTKDEELLAKPEPEKPEPPGEFDPDQARLKVVQ